MLGTSLLLLVGYALLKSWMLEHVPYERAVALGGLYHWSSLVLLAACWSIWLVRQKAVSYTHLTLPTILRV